MTADGNWNLVVSTPMGERRATLSLKADGGTLTGSQMADGNTAEIFDGTVDGNQLAWKVSISDPMPLTLEFSGTVDGNELTGSVMLGTLAALPSPVLAVSKSRTSGWFIEGFDFRDLKSARALLEEFAI